LHGLELYCNFQQLLLTLEQGTVKKLVSITLILILLLNTFGYYGVFLGLQYRNERSIERTLDQNLINDSDAIVVKVPMSVPYMPDQAGFEKVNGKFEHNGEMYRLVKQRYANDTLTVVCIKDTGHKKINQVWKEYARTFTDLRDQTTPTKLSVNFLKEYVLSVFSLQQQSSGWATSLSYRTSCRAIIDFFPPSIAQPPEEV